ncbi:hypothetical protein QBC43DRAFT_336926 [Cladorrhinum sp. PSN259]|nr:hypothetical protein QBC43DRAFT_336926 [Cladorrhinum sp. PSN259]
MKLSTVLYGWLPVASTAAATVVLPATAASAAMAPMVSPPTQQNTIGRPVSSNPLPAPESGPEKVEVRLTRCFGGCLGREFRNAGCGSPNDWDCLCRSGTLAVPVFTCWQKSCEARGFQERFALDGVKYVYSMTPRCSINRYRISSVPV